MMERGYIVFVERSFPSVLESHYYYFRKAPGYYDAIVNQHTTLEEYLQQNDQFLAELAWRWRHTKETWTALAHAHPDRIQTVAYLDLALPMRRNDTLDALSTFLHTFRRTDPGQNWTGVSVGAGKGPQEPSAAVQDAAQRALRKSMQLKDTHMYDMSFYMYGKPLSPELECDASFKACPVHSNVQRFMEEVNEQKRKWKSRPE